MARPTEPRLAPAVAATARDPVDPVGRDLSGPGGDAERAEQLSRLASRLTQVGLFRDALDLLDTAAHLGPESPGLALHRARVIERKQQADGEALGELDARIRAETHGRAVRAGQYLGYAEMLLERGQTAAARQAFERAHEASPGQYAPLLLLAKLAVDRNDAAAAIAHLEAARVANPFSQQIANMLGSLYIERSETERALYVYVDALLLSGNVDLDDIDSFDVSRAGIANQLAQIATVDLLALMRERGTALRALVRRLSNPEEADDDDRDGALDLSDDELDLAMAADPIPVRDQAAEALAARLVRLREFAIFEGLDDRDLGAIALHLEEQELDAQQSVFEEGQVSASLYFIERGAIAIRKVSSLGSHTLHTLAAGEVLGRINFLEGRPHTAHAITTEPTRLLVMNRSWAEDLLSDRRNIAVRMLVYFWRTLAEHIRESNRSFESLMTSRAFQAERRLDRAARAEAEKIVNQCNERIAEFKRTGLSAAELELLTKMSPQSLLDKDALIFGQGEDGQSLYIVIAGSVRISRSAPDDAEEVLAVLRRGDVFGEMALIDRQPRSANARAHEPSTRVIAIKRTDLDQILRGDVATAQQFVSLICRILARRLREIDETIVKWRVITGIA